MWILGLKGLTLKAMQERKTSARREGKSHHRLVTQCSYEGSVV